MGLGVREADCATWMLGPGVKATQAPAGPQALGKAILAGRSLRQPRVTNESSHWPLAELSKEGQGTPRWHSWGVVSACLLVM